MDSACLKILVVDDDQGDRKQILRLVGRCDFACVCTEASTMEEALAFAEHTRFDCVIVDYHLPGQNGLEGIVTMLRRDAFLPVVVTTGQGCERLASEAFKIGAMDYVSKADLNVQTIQPLLEGVMRQANLNRKVSEQQTALAVFAKVLVHDLKTPIQSVLGFAKLIETFLGQPDFDRQKVTQLSRRIADGALRMNALLNNLHAYTEADARPQIETVSLSAVLESVLIDLDMLIRRSGARVNHGVLPHVDADPAQLAQLLQNLVGNGIKYCKAATPEIWVDTAIDTDGALRIEIRDNGIGIPKDQCVSIFEPFRRLHAQGEYEGTGLGLATCAKIVEHHGGKIWCVSEVGRGTSFFFTLASEAEAPSGPPDPRH